MALQFQIYHSSEPNAPVLDPVNRQNYLQVLRACLVTGFGSRAPAGWSEPLTPDSNRAVIRPAVGSNGAPYYQLHASAVSGGLHVAQWGDIVSLDGGTILHSAYVWGASSTAGSTWVVLANDRTCLFYQNSGSYQRVFLIGKLVSLLAGVEAWMNCGVAPSSSTSLANALFSSFNYGQSTSFYRFPGLTLLPGATNQCVIAPEESFWVVPNDAGEYGGTSGSLSSFYHRPAWRTFPKPFFGVDGVGKLMPLYCWSYQGFSGSSSQKAQGQAGAMTPSARLPGIFGVLFGGGLNPHDIIEGTGQFSGRSFYYLKVNCNSAGYSSSVTSSPPMPSDGEFYQGLAVEISDTLVNY